MDGRAACSAETSGKGQWVLRTAAALLKKTSLTILTDGRPVPQLWRVSEATIRALPKGTFWHIAAVRALKKECPDVYIAPSSFIVPAMLPGSIRCVPVVHDLIAFQKDSHEWKAKIIERMTLGRALRNAAQVCVISDSTKKDLVEQFSFVRSEHVSVIFAGPLEAHPAPSIPDGQTILCPGTLCPRKNQMRLLQAYAGLPSDLRNRYRLLLVGGRGWNDAAIVTLAAATPGAQWRGYVPDPEYRKLLSSCTVLAFPSLYEGFGLPVLDALQRGIPVLTTNRGGIPEITDHCSVTVKPESVEDIRRGLLEILTNEKLREKLSSCGPARAQEFSWERTARLLLGAIQQ